MTEPIRILYVDDSRYDRELVRDALHKDETPFVLTEAACREEFEALLAEGDYDLVLSDFNILGYEGLQVIDAVRAKNPLVPVVIVTGTGSEEIAVEAMKRGAADYVIKTPRHIQRLPITLRAVLERKRLQEEHDRLQRKVQESQRLESLGVLAGGIAHDFNNLMTGIVGNVGLALMGMPRDADYYPMLKRVEEIALRAAELCRQLFAYAGKGRFLMQRLDLSAVVRDTTDLVRVSISKKANLDFDLAADLPPVLADATQLRQVIMNLVLNASEALGDQGGLIRITTGVRRIDHRFLAETYLASELVEGEYVMLEVCDNGCGMTPQTLARIFDPFFTTKSNGRGLGLAAVLGIVRSHQGALRVESELGKGTCFQVLLPCADGRAAEASGPRTARTGWRGHGTVLVVDDEEFVRDVATRVLRANGFDVLPARHGRDALQQFRTAAERIRLVLLDLTMPHLNGEETFQELRRLRPNVRVLLMSGYNDREVNARFEGPLPAAFLQKPFRPEDLLEAVRRALEE